MYFNALLRYLFSIKYRSGRFVCHSDLLQK